MKSRKHKITYYAEELSNIADKVNSEAYQYECFRSFIWGNIYSAASKGEYKVSLNVSQWDDKFIERIKDELLRHNLTCNSYTLTSNLAYRYDDSPIIKTFQICWNYDKAYVHIK